MIRRPPRSTLDRSSAASDVYKRQGLVRNETTSVVIEVEGEPAAVGGFEHDLPLLLPPVSYTHLRAHETVLDLVCRLLLEKKKQSSA